VFPVTSVDATEANSTSNTFVLALSDFFVGPAKSQLCSLEHFLMRVPQPTAATLLNITNMLNSCTTSYLGNPVRTRYMPSIDISSCLQLDRIHKRPSTNNHQCGIFDCKITPVPFQVVDTNVSQYVSEFTTLSQAVIARGRAWHSEFNQPVYAALANLATAIQVR